MAMRLEMMWRPPANRSTEASSAMRTLVFDTSTLASSSFTSAVNATSSSHLSSCCRAASFAAEIAVLHAHDDARHRCDAFTELACDGNRAVLAAGASDRDRGMPFVLALVTGEHRLERLRVGVDEVAGAGLVEHVLGDRGVFAAEVPQLGDPEGIRQEPCVGDEVGVGRQAVLEAEALQGDPEPGAPRLGERVGDQ